MSETTQYLDMRELSRPVFEVSDESGLRRALAAADSLPRVTIRVNSTIALTEMVYAVLPETDVLFVGNETAGTGRLDLAGVSGRVHGVHLVARSITVRALRVENYDADGSALKLSAGSVVRVIGCGFRRCGVTPAWYTKPADTSRDQKYVTCISCHSAPDILEVRDCLFENCCTDSWQWSHCIYASARAAMVRGCVFRGGGNPLSIRTSSDGGIQVVSGCRFLSPVPCATRTGDMSPPFVASLIPTQRAVFVGNTVSGTWDTVFVGSTDPDSRLHTFSGNDYGEVTLARGMMADTSYGRYITQAGWRAYGYDL